MKVLETERLTLRWFHEGDAAFVLELTNDPGWIANIGDRGLRTIDDARAWIAERLAAPYWEKGLGLWAVERRSDGAPVGMCGLVDRDSLPDVDVGYAFVPHARGNGFAREAARATLEYACDALGKQCVFAIVRPENRASIRVLEALGMTPDGVRTLAGEKEPSAVFTWSPEGSGRDAVDDPRSEIDAIARRFFAAFSNTRGVARIASVPSMFIPGAIVTTVTAGASPAVSVSNVRNFVAPRATLLLDGRLRDFEEEETSGATEIHGDLAVRWSRYRKVGTLDGERFEGGGTKTFQLARTPRGWRIVALAWEDDRASHS